MTLRFLVVLCVLASRPALSQTNRTWTYKPATSLNRYDARHSRAGTDFCADYNNVASYGYQICDPNASCAHQSAAASGGLVDLIQCTCNTGYDGTNGAFTRLFGEPCVDIDECTSATHTCHQHATCTNTLGSYTCACNRGYYGDGYQTSTGTGHTGCTAIADPFSACTQTGYYNTAGNPTCRKFFDLKCRSDGKVEVKVHMTYVNNLLLTPYNKTQGAVSIGFLDPDCASTPAITSELTNQETNEFYTYTLALNECGFRSLRNLSNFDYFDNAIVLTSPYLSSQSSSLINITRGDYAMFRFQCTYDSSEGVQSTSNNTVVESIDLDIAKHGHYTVSMHAYVDSGFTQLLDQTHTVGENDPVYVKIETATLIAGLERTLVIESCFLNDMEDQFQNETKTINIIENYCSSSSDVTLNSTAGTTASERSVATFSMYPFKIDPNYEQVFISCDVRFKKSSDALATCTSSTQRKRRDIVTKLRVSEPMPSIHMGSVHDTFKPQHGPILRANSASHLKFNKH